MVLYVSLSCVYCFCWNENLASDGVVIEIINHSPLISLIECCVFGVNYCLIYVCSSLFKDVSNKYARFQLKNVICSSIKRIAVKSFTFKQTSRYLSIMEWCRICCSHFSPKVITTTLIIINPIKRNWIEGIKIKNRIAKLKFGFRLVDLLAI